MEKKMAKRRGQEFYLLGKGIDGNYYWLKSSEWACDWYWSIGWVEVFTNQLHPELAKDIQFHQHFDGLFFKNPNQNGYDAFKEFFAETPFTDKEIWTLLELMRTADTLEESAEVFNRGGSNYTSNPCKDIIQNRPLEDEINQNMLPAIFKKIKEVLTGEYTG